ncbi:MAG: lysophospholipid acyltransferase family protein, partial [Fusobacteriaceae bacterium]
RHKIEYFAFLGLLKFIPIFPESWRFKFAESIGILTYNLLRMRRNITLANLDLAFPDMEEKEKEKIAKESYKIMTKSFMSSLWFDEYFNNPKNIKVSQMEKIDELMSRKKGLVAACMHTGNLEASLKVSEKYHFVCLAKPQANPYINDYIIKQREKRNITLLMASPRNGRELINLIDKKPIFALFCDHRMTGTRVNFFGKEVSAANGPVSLALKNNIPLVIQYNVMNPDNTCSINITDEIKLIDTGKFKEDVAANVQLLIHEVEKVIKKHPEQWMWFHNRWEFQKKEMKKRQPKKS